MEQIRRSSLQTNEFFAAFVEQESLESLIEFEKIIEEKKKKLQQ